MFISGKERRMNAVQLITLVILVEIFILALVILSIF